MNILEILAVILAVMVLIKIGVVLMVGPKKWIGFVWPLYKHAKIAMVVVAVLALWMGCYIFRMFSVVEVGAVALFVVFVMWLSFLAYPAMLEKMKEASLERNVRSAWLSIVIWVAFAVWILWAVFVS